MISEKQSDRPSTYYSIMYSAVLLAAALLLGVQVQAEGGWYIPTRPTTPAIPTWYPSTSTSIPPWYPSTSTVAPTLDPPTTTEAPAPQVPPSFVPCVYNSVQSALKKHNCLGIPRAVKGLFYKAVEHLQEDVNSLIHQSVKPVEDCLAKRDFKFCVSSFARIPMRMVKVLYAVAAHIKELSQVVLKIVQHSGECLTSAKELMPVLKDIRTCFWWTPTM
uniref:Uncharacterized protein n=1 Tax=Lygus hesperus TaxID=30085 RepID=A0A0A9Y8Z0_LYGHE